MAKVGYARVSSVGQSLESQLSRLNSAGVDTIYQDKLSGTTADRPQLKECRRYLRKGDTLVITRLDRLARSTFHLCQIREELIAKGVELVVLDQSIDTTSSTGKLMFNMLGAISEFENEIRKERQRDGIEAAKARGTKFGRKAKLTSDQVLEMRKKRESGTKIKTLMEEYDIGKTAVYRLLSEA